MDAGAMIIGIGSDLCNIDRIQESLDRFGDRFLNRVFTETERAKAARGPLHHRAGRWPSASPPRRLSPRRSAPASSAASS